jgi:hypothetical protein
MDVVFTLIVVALFAATVWLARAVSRLGGGE